MSNRKAAYFLLFAEYFGRPLDDGIIRALLKAGYEVDIFTPSPSFAQTIYPPSVQIRTVEYRKKWIFEYFSPLEWRKYHILLGTCDMPMAIAGILGKISGRSFATVCDEIYIGRTGVARLYWKTLSKWAMRNSRFTIITDPCRVDLQREYASLPRKHKFVSYPCCFPTAYEGPSRNAMRERLGIRQDEFVVSLAGGFHEFSGATEAIYVLDKMPRDYRLMIQTGGYPDALSHQFLKTLQNVYPISYFPERVGYREAVEITSATDVGLVFYMSKAPQDQRMGLSSQKLCNFLRLGKPVIASYQDSFHFIEEFGCGVLVRDRSEILSALEQIRVNYETYSENALRCFSEYVRPAEKMNVLAALFSELYDTESRNS